MLRLFLVLSLALAVWAYPVVENSDDDDTPSYSAYHRELPYLKPKSEWWNDETQHIRKVFLCLDGGALKGIVPTTVMIELEKQIKIHIINHIEDYEVFNVEPGKTKDDFNFNTINDFKIYLADFFHGIAGISAGSWITAYLVSKGGDGASNKILHRASILNKYGYHDAGSLQGLRVFFLEYGRRIYPQPSAGVTIKSRGFFRRPQIGFKPVTEPSYTPDGLEWTLKQFIGDVKLSQVATSTLVVAFDLKRLSAVEFIADYLDDDATEFRPTIFTGVAISKIQSNSAGLVDEDYMPKPIVSNPTNLKDVTATALPKVTAEEVEGMDKIYDLDYYIRDIVRASSAFPMIHPSKLVKPLNDISNYFDMIDGAMVGNNPSMPMIAWALTHKQVKSLSHIALLSLGTGFTTGSYADLGAGGTMQWQAPITDLVMASTPEFLHSVMDYVYYSTASSNYGDETSVKIEQNQLLRIQLIRPDDSEDGAIMDSGYQNYDELKALEEMGKLLAAKYRENIIDFVSKFMLYKAGDGDTTKPGTTESYPPVTPSPVPAAS